MRPSWTNPHRGLAGARVRGGIRFGLTEGPDFQGIHPRPGTSFRLQPVGFNVDEDTLYNVIDLLHSRPELRELAGREEGSVLVRGPKRSLRKNLRRIDVWLQWERAIHAAVTDVRER